MNSMTGFGRAKLEKDTREYLVEIRSVNHKYADITVKAPRNLLYLEDKIRKVVLNKVSRGKIEIYINYANYGIEGKEVIINKELAKLYIKELKSLAQENEIPDGLRASEISKMPDILNVQVEEESLEMVWIELSQCLEKALDNFIEMRMAEGEKIKQDLKMRLQDIAKNVDEISCFSTRLVEEYVVKLEERIKEILKTDIVDQTRLAQEIVIYSDKYSIEEELTRLKSHIEQFNAILNAKEPCGKKIDFLVQEMNRETNTIGSKSGKLEITNLVIELKTRLEDIREQIQNIE
ncbi:MAG: YicC family protein [Clostridia bacterium]|nr:YicC family protein [Clostridia bacterium]